MLTDHIIDHLQRLGYAVTIEQTPTGVRAWATMGDDSKVVEVQGRDEDARYRAACGLAVACGVDFE